MATSAYCPAQLSHLYVFRLRARCVLETEFLDSFMAVCILELNVVLTKDLKRSLK